MNRFFYNLFNFKNNKDLIYLSDNLYLSNWYTACNADLLSQHEIQEIFCLSDKKKPSHVFLKYKKHRILHHYVYIEDKKFVTNIISKFEEIYNQINGKTHNILVHCMGGHSRSCGFYIYYMMKKYNASLEKTYQYMKMKRSKIKLSRNIEIQVILFEKYNEVLKNISDEKEKNQNNLSESERQSELSNEISNSENNSDRLLNSNSLSYSESVSEDNQYNKPNKLKPNKLKPNKLKQNKLKQNNEIDRYQQIDESSDSDKKSKNLIDY